MSRLPVRLRDELRVRQPLAGPGGAGRPERRQPRLPTAVSVSGGSVADPLDTADWACRIGERLPANDVRRLAEAAAAGQPGVRQLRAAAGSVILRDACDQLSKRLADTEPAYVSGLLTGVARAVERGREHQTVSVVWTGPESGVSSSRLTAAAVIDLINAARSEILLVSYATQTEPALKAALSAATARHVAVTLLIERYADNPTYTAASTPFPGLNALRLYWPACLAPARRRIAREDHRGRRPGRARRQREPHQPSDGDQSRMRHPHPRRPATPRHPQPHHRPTRRRTLGRRVRSAACKYTARLVPDLRLRGLDLRQGSVAAAPAGCRGRCRASTGCRPVTAPQSPAAHRRSDVPRWPVRTAVAIAGP